MSDSQHPMVCLNTQAIVVYDFTPSPWNQINIVTLQAQGWRDLPPTPPPVADGFQRSAITYIEGDGITAQAHYTDMIIADIQAAEEAAQAAQEAQAKSDYNARVQAVSTQAHIFRATLQKYFGAGAETNQAITQTSVQAYFIGLQQAGTVTAQNLADAEVLNTLFPVLSAITGDGTTWTFPWSTIP